MRADGSDWELPLVLLQRENLTLHSAVAVVKNVAGLLLAALDIPSGNRGAMSWLGLVWVVSCWKIWPWSQEEVALLWCKKNPQCHLLDLRAPLSLPYLFLLFGHLWFVFNQPGQQTGYHLFPIRDPNLSMVELHVHGAPVAAYWSP